MRRLGGFVGRLNRRACAVVVVNYGSSELLSHNLVQVQIECPELLVVVLDNFTTRDEQESVVELGVQHGWHVELLPENVGFGAGCNRGARHAQELGAEAYIFLNPDAFVGAECIDALIAHVNRNSDSIVTPVIQRSDGRVWFAGMELRLADGAMRRSSTSRSVPGVSQRWLTGACMLVPAHVWTTLGGFNERYFLYWEDVELSTRAERAGFELIVANDAVAIHDAHGTQEQNGEGKSSAYYYYSVRNRLLFAADLLPPSTLRSWMRSGPRAAREILLRGGRRQLLRPVAPLTSIFRGAFDGRRLAGQALAEIAHPRPAQPVVVRSYESVRTAHFERDSGRDVTILYGTTRYDADAGVAAGAKLVRASVAAAFRFALYNPIDVIEINEPLYLRTVPRSMAVIFGNRLRSIRHGRRAVVVTYAIENLDPMRAHARSLRARIRRRVSRMGASFLWRRLDRVVFGTQGAKDLYTQTFGDTPRLTESALIQSLPSAAPGALLNAERAPTVVFLGQLSPRKGFDAVLRCWPAVVATHPDAQLVIIGKGAGEQLAIAASEDDTSISVVIDPPRARIFEELQRAKVLVLPSRRMPAWREQVGLPIVEGLSYGCEIVTTIETGLAAWLAAHGHQVVRDDSDNALASALLSSLMSSRLPADVVADLPETDGRLAAESWLTAMPRGRRDN